jgi:EF hand
MRILASAFLVAVCGISPSDAAADLFDESLVLFVQRVDSNRNGLASRDEFSAAIDSARTRGIDERSAHALQMMKHGFSMIDRNRDGQLSADEISTGVNARFASADRNGNGTLTPDEASSGMPMVARNFAIIDARGTGSVSLQQVRNFLAQSIKSAFVSTRAF